MAPAPEVAPATTAWRAGWQLRLILLFSSFAFLAIPGGVLAGSGQNLVVGVALLGAFAALNGFLFWHQAGVAVLLHPDGIERRGRFGARRVRWSELRSYVYTPHQRQTYYGGGLVGVAVAVAVALTEKQDPLTPSAFVLTGADGARVRIGPFINGHKELIRRLVALATEALYPAAVRAFDAGEALRFGDRLTVRRGAGVTWRGFLGGERTLPFERLERAQMLERTSLVLRTPGKAWPWLRVMMQSVPNLFVLIQLLNHARQPAGVQLAPPPGGERLPSA